jgi:hypothetical protein
MDNLWDKAFALFVAYEQRIDPHDLEPVGRMIAGMTSEKEEYRIRMRQIMFALAYREFGKGNQEEFFRLVQKYNKTAPARQHLGPKKFSSPKSLRAYLKKGQAWISDLETISFIRRNYEEGL